MTIQWNIVATIAAPTIALFIGGWLNRRFEKRPRLISYFGHVAAFRLQPPGGQPVHFHTHAVVLRNAGRHSATNVRLRHNVLPDFNIWPAVQHQTVVLPDGSAEIVIPTLVPGELITISYLYFPPLTFTQVNAGILCDQGFAHAIPVLLQREYPRWLSVVVVALALIGLIALLYFAYQVGRLLVR